MEMETEMEMERAEAIGHAGWRGRRGAFRGTVPPVRHQADEEGSSAEVSRKARLQGCQGR
eukprot:12292558-Prorocentrum_lima.AAC.1